MNINNNKLKNDQSRKRVYLFISAIAAAFIMFASACSSNDVKVSGQSTTTSTQNTSLTTDISRAQGASAMVVSGLDECLNSPDTLCGEAPTDTGFKVGFTLLPASDPKNIQGLLVLHFGGPGSDARSLVAGWRNNHASRELLDQFDILGVSQRGAAQDGLDCGNDKILHDIFTGRVAYSNRYRAQELTKIWIEGCPTDDFGTVTAASDIQSVISYLDPGKTIFVGYSYGGVIGSLLVSAYPGLIDAVVLDSPALTILDPYVGPDQIESFQTALDDFFDACDETLECGFAPAGRSSEVFQTYARLYKKPGDLLYSMGLLLYNETTKPELDFMLTAAIIEDDDSFITSYADIYFDRVDSNYPSSVELFRLITCADELDDFTNKPSVAYATYNDLGVLGELAAFVWAPAAGSCDNWHGEPSPFTLDLSDVKADVLVIASRDDPAIPWKTLEPFINSFLPDQAGLVLADGLFHGLWGIGNTCVDDVINEFIIDGVTPAEVVECGHFQLNS